MVLPSEGSVLASDAVGIEWRGAATDNITDKSRLLLRTLKMPDCEGEGVVPTGTGIRESVIPEA